MSLDLILSILLQSDVVMADGLRQDGKFWVVIAVVAVVTLGILLYLFLLDKRVSKLEKQ
ncbi:CcmD family protein [Jiulongibacter sediminis]|uniref:CcmD family protein n=1 Tax=Jiulongibacter sediminis TaxID=1605367 RepID=UPI000BAA1418|nr:CcmD family protein [Jiulongibacter sediminis]